MTTTTSWTATTTLTATTSIAGEDLLNIAGVFEEDVPDAGAAVGGDERALEVTLTVDAAGALEAAAAAAKIALHELSLCGLGKVTLIGLEVITVDEHDRRLADPAYPELVGVSEVAELLGITRQRASALQTRMGFPAPMQVLAGGPVWRRSAVDRFASTWERKVGRPRKVSADG